MVYQLSGEATLKFLIFPRLVKNNKSIYSIKIEYMYLKTIYVFNGVIYMGIQIKTTDLLNNFIIKKLKVRLLIFFSVFFYNFGW